MLTASTPTITAQTRIQAALASSKLRVDGAGVDVRISDGTRTWPFNAVERNRSPYPGELAAMSAETPEPRLLVAEYVSATTARHLEEHNWSWVDDAGNAGVVAKGLHIDVRVTSDAPDPVKRLSQGTDTLRLIRFLVASTTTGQELSPGPLAGATGLARPRVSQILEELRRLELTSSLRHGVWSADRARLLDAFLSGYRGPKGVVTYWHSLDNPTDVTARLVAAGENVAVSGDVAADLTAPWRRPTNVLVYATEMMHVAGASAARAGDANVEVRIPRDPTVFATVPWVSPSGVLIADPLQVLWDMQQAGGDRLEAQDQLRTWILEHT